MININFLLVLFSILKLVNASAQNTFTNQQYGFSITKPESWTFYRTSSFAVLDSIKDLKLNNTDLLNVITSNKNQIPLTIFCKYDAVHDRINPLINVMIRPNKTTNTHDFFELINKYPSSIKEVYKDAESVVQPKIILIDGIESVYLVTKYSLLFEGKAIHVRMRQYSIPKDNYYFQINCIDSSTDENEDCSLLFDQIQNTIRIARN